MSVAPEVRTADINSGPAMTSDSLLARSSRLPARAAARRGLKSCRADDRCDDVIDLRKRGDLGKSAGPGKHLSLYRQARHFFSQLTGSRRIGEHRVIRLPFLDLLRELRRIAVRGEGHHAELVTMLSQHIESAGPYRSRRAEHGNADHVPTPSVVRPKYSTGAAAVTLSMRSITPPWPGKMEPLSFTPA